MVMVMVTMKKKNKSVICMLLVLLLAVNYATEAESACTRRCGDVDIPFPFGIEDGCFGFSFENVGFDVVCNDSKLYYRDIQLVGIDVDNFTATVLQPIGTDCPDNNVAAGRSYAWSGMNLTGSPFSLSYSRNTFAAIGCDAHAFFNTSTYGGNFSDFNTSGSCVSHCNSDAANGTCSGNDGCCQTAIPPAQQFTFYLSNDSVNSSSNSCRYSFLVDRDWFYLNSSWYLPGGGLLCAAPRTCPRRRHLVLRCRLPVPYSVPNEFR